MRSEFDAKRLGLTEVTLVIRYGMRPADWYEKVVDGLTVTPGDRVQVKPGGVPPVQFSVLKTWPEGATRIEPLTVIKIKAKLDRSQPV